MSKRWFVVTGFALVILAVVMLGLGHDEAKADSRPDQFICSDMLLPGTENNPGNQIILHCKAGKMSCGILWGGSISCVNNKGGLFK